MLTALGSIAVPAKTGDEASVLDSLPMRLLRKVEDLHRIQRTLAVLSDKVRMSALSRTFQLVGGQSSAGSPQPKVQKLATVLVSPEVGQSTAEGVPVRAS